MSDDFDLDDFDLDGLDFSGDEFSGVSSGGDKKDRKPVERVAKGASEGAKRTLMAESTRRKIVRESLPKGYSDAYDGIGDTITLGRDLYDTSATALRPARKGLQKITKMVLPEVEGFLPKGIKEKLDAFVNEKDDAADLAKVDYREAEMDSQLGEIFKTQMEHAETMDAREEARTVASDQVEQKRHEGTLGYLDDMRSALSRMVGYQDDILTAYQRKHLELEYRQLYVSQDLLASFNDYRRLNEAALKDIVKNTALPEHVKVRTGELAGQMFRQRIIGNLQDNVADYTRDYLSNMRTNLLNATKSKMTEFAQQVSDAGEMLSMMEEDGASDRLEFVGDIAGSFAADNAAMWVARGLNSITKKSQFLNKRGLDAEYVFRHRGMLLKEFLEETAKKYGKDSEAYGEAKSAYESFDDYMEGGEKKKRGFLAGLLSKPMDVIKRMAGMGADAALTLTKSHAVVDTIGVTDKTLADEALSYNALADKAITQVIPGLLSDILHVNERMLTGDDTISRKVFNYKRDEFTREDELKSDLLKSFLPEDDLKSIRAELLNMTDLILGKDAPVTVRADLSRKLLDWISSGHGISLSRLVNPESMIDLPDESRQYITNAISNQLLDGEGKLRDDIKSRESRNKIMDYGAFIATKLPNTQRDMAIQSQLYGSSVFKDMGLASVGKDGQTRVNRGDILDYITEDKPLTERAPVRPTISEVFSSNQRRIQGMSPQELARAQSTFEKPYIPPEADGLRTTLNPNMPPDGSGSSNDPNYLAAIEMVYEEQRESRTVLERIYFILQKWDENPPWGGGPGGPGGGPPDDGLVQFEGGWPGDRPNDDPPSGSPPWGDDPDGSPPSSDPFARARSYVSGKAKTLKDAVQAKATDVRQVITDNKDLYMELKEAHGHKGAIELLLHDKALNAKEASEMNMLHLEDGFGKAKTLTKDAFDTSSEFVGGKLQSVKGTATGWYSKAKQGLTDVKDSVKNNDRFQNAVNAVTSNKHYQSATAYIRPHAEAFSDVLTNAKATVMGELERVGAFGVLDDLSKRIGSGIIDDERRTLYKDILSEYGFKDGIQLITDDMVRDAIAAGVKTKDYLRDDAIDDLTSKYETIKTHFEENPITLDSVKSSMEELYTTKKTSLKDWFEGKFADAELPKVDLPEEVSNIFSMEKLRAKKKTLRDGLMAVLGDDMEMQQVSGSDIQASMETPKPRGFRKFTFKDAVDVIDTNTTRPISEDYMRMEAANAEEHERELLDRLKDAFSKENVALKADSVQEAIFGTYASLSSWVNTQKSRMRSGGGEPPSGGGDGTEPPDRPYFDSSSLESAIRDLTGTTQSIDGKLAHIIEFGLRTSSGENAVGGEFTGPPNLSLWQKTKRLGGRAWEGTKALPGKAWRGTKRAAGKTWEGIKGAGGLAGRALWGATKGVGKGLWGATKLAGKGAWGGTKLAGKFGLEAAKFAGKQGLRQTGGFVKGLFGKNDAITDIYLKGNPEPIILKRDLKAGIYLDQRTGEPIKAFKDIRGPVVDPSGNIVITQKDIDEKRLVKPSGRSIGNMVGGATRAVGGALGRFASTGYGALWRATKWTYGKARDVVKRYIGDPHDVYVKGETKPRLIRKLFEEGAYFDAKSGEVISKVKDIKGPVKDRDGNTLLSAQDLTKGIHGPVGNLIRTTFRVATAPVRLAWRGIRAVGRGLRGIGRLMGRGLRGLGRMIRGAGRRLLGLAREDPAMATVMANIQTNEILADIHDLLDSRIPERENIRKGSWRDRLLNSKKEKKDDKPSGIVDKGKSLLKGLGGSIASLFGLGAGARGKGGEEEGGDGSTVIVPPMLPGGNKTPPPGGKKPGLLRRMGRGAVSLAVAGAKYAWVGAKWIVGGVISVIGLKAAIIAAIAVGVALGGWYLWRRHKAKVYGPLHELRLMQYGINPKTGDHVRKIKAMEKLLSRKVKYGADGKAELTEFTDDELATLAKNFDVSVEDERDLDRFAHWFAERGSVVFLKHMTALKQNGLSTKLEEVDKTLSDDEKYAYVKDQTFEGDIFYMRSSPFMKDRNATLPVVPYEIEAFRNKLLDDLTETSTNDSKTVGDTETNVAPEDTLKPIPTPVTAAAAATTVSLMYDDNTPNITDRPDRPSVGQTKVNRGVVAATAAAPTVASMYQEPPASVSRSAAPTASASEPSSLVGASAVRDVEGAITVLERGLGSDIEQMRSKLEREVRTAHQREVNTIERETQTGRMMNLSLATMAQAMQTQVSLQHSMDMTLKEMRDLMLGEKEDEKKTVSARAAEASRAKAEEERVKREIDAANKRLSELQETLTKQNNRTSSYGQVGRGVSLNRQ